MFGVDYRLAGDSEYRNLHQGYDTYLEAEMAADELAKFSSIGEVVVTESNPFEVER